MTRPSIPALAATVMFAATVTGAWAKLPPPSPEAKAKLEETAARTAWTNKVADYQLCKADERVAAVYLADAKKAGKDVKAPVTTPPCADPGPFVYVAPDARPLEAAGAHSPPETASKPPSTAVPGAEQKPAKKN